MWVLILTLQFLVYVEIWKIDYPQLTRFLLHEFRRIALGEFMEDLEIGKEISTMLNIETDD